MMTHMTTEDVRLTIRSWDEQPYRELPGGRVLKSAEVVLGGDGEPLEGTWRALLYYNPDGTSAFTGVLPVSGSLGGRAGSFVLAGRGTFDGTTAEMGLEIIPGSGTGDLDGIKGRAEHASTHADYPHFPLLLTYEIG
jgi:hypothetical protein